MSDTLTTAMAQLFVSEKSGNDETGDGTEKSPFKTLLKVLY